MPEAFIEIQPGWPCRVMVLEGLVTVYRVFIVILGTHEGIMLWVSSRG